jgi:Flp pilus assembly pilin Flp
MRPLRASLRADERGSVTVEYAVILTVVALGCVLATVSLGVPLVRAFEAREAWLLLPLP